MMDPREDRNMNARFLSAILALIILGAGGASTAEKRTLAGVFEPEMIRIADGSLYVVEGANVLVYSLADLRLKTKMGGAGEGPGELKVLDYWYNTLTILPEHVFLDGYDKVVWRNCRGSCLSHNMHLESHMHEPHSKSLCC